MLLEAVMLASVMTTDLKKGAVETTTKENVPLEQTVSFQQNHFTGETVVIRTDATTGKVYKVETYKNKGE